MPTVKVLKETKFRLAECKKHLSGSSYWNLYRWAMQGYGPRGKKVFLEYAREGRALYTSKEAYDRFLKKINTEK